MLSLPSGILEKREKEKQSSMVERKEITPASRLDHSYRNRSDYSSVGVTIRYASGSGLTGPGKGETKAAPFSRFA